MAGIGFELRKILKEETFTAQARAYTLGAIIAVGPFLCSVLALAGLSAFASGVLELDQRQVFTGGVVHVFGGSLVVTGLLQVVVTRYLSDQIYRGENERLIYSLFPVLLVASALLAVIGAPFVISLPLSPLTRLVLFSLYLITGCLWLVAVFVSTAHGHWAVVTVFLAGSAAAFGAGAALGRQFGIEGLLAGYTLGHALMLALLVRHLLGQFGFPRRWDWGALRYLRVYPALILIGVLQNLGYWVDKFVFWTSELQVSAAGIATAPKYDSAMFLAFLTVLPAITHFFVKQEADFSEKFHRYFDEVFFRSSYERVRIAASSLRTSVIAALTEILALQGVTTFLCAFFAEDILRALGLPVSQVGMFRCGVIGSLFLAFFMFSNVLLLYFDRQRAALASVTTMFVVNLGLSLVSLRLGYPFFGYGFAAACLSGVLVSLTLLADHLYNLEYRTFVSIPIVGQRRPGHKLRAWRGGRYGRYHPLGGAGS